MKPDKAAASKSWSREYRNLVSQSRSSLDFLLDNLGRDIELDCSIESIQAVEELLKETHRHPNPDSLFPEVVELLAQLLAQYATFVLVEKTRADWRVDEAESSAFFGQPFVDVVPPQDWNRFFPIEEQKALRDPEVALRKGPKPLFKKIDTGIRDNQKYRALVDLLRSLLGSDSDGSGLSEVALIESVTASELAPDPRFFKTAASRFRDLTLGALVAENEFIRGSSSKTWRLQQK